MLCMTAMCWWLTHILDPGHTSVHLAIDAPPGRLDVRVCSKTDILDDKVVQLGLRSRGAEATSVAAAFAPHVDALQWSSTMSARTFLQFDE